MLDAILKFSIERSKLILVFVFAVAMLGLWNFQKLPIDAVPDITNVQVVINTEALGYTPLEVEQRITFPLETALSGVPNLSYTRSVSRYGLSQVVAIFNDEGRFIQLPGIHRVPQEEEDWIDDVIPYLSPDAVTGIMKKLQSLR